MMINGLRKGSGGDKPKPARFELTNRDLQIPTRVSPQFEPLQLSIYEFDEGDLNIIGSIEGFFDPLAPVDGFSSLFLPIATPQTWQFDFAHRYWKRITKNSTTEAEISRRPKKRMGKVRRSVDKPEPSQLPPPAFSLTDALFFILSPSPLLPNASDYILPHRLYDYQRDGIEFLVQNRSALLADDMGTGKTVMALIALKRLFQLGEIRRALIVCPVAVLEQWREHLEIWTPDLSDFSTLVRGKNRESQWQSSQSICLTNYETLGRDVPKPEIASFLTFDLIILDEAHRVKNPARNQFKAIERIGRHAKYRWALTGTPLQNRLSELQTLCRVLHPQDSAHILQINDPEEMRRYISPFFLRRRKKDVMADLPEKTYQELWLTMNKPQREAYELARQGFIVELRSLGTNYTQIAYSNTVIRNLQRLKQICNFPPGEYNSPKLDDLLTRLHEVHDAGAKALVFSQYVDEGVDKIMRVLGNGGSIIKGGQSDGERQRQIQRFKQGQDIFALVASVKAAGEGLNLTEASYVFHFDHWWNPATMRQAEDRAHRQGQTRAITVISYWMKGTIDERIHSLLREKTELFSKVIDDVSPSDVVRQFTREEWLEILSSSPSVSQVKTNELLGTPALEMTVEEIRDVLFRLSPDVFEVFVADLLRHMNYKSVRVIGGSGDGGIDIRARKQDGQVVAVQCKRYRHDVQPEKARDFYGALQMQSIPHGLFITTSNFTTACRDFLMSASVEMINGYELASLAQRYGLSIPFV